MTTVTFLQNHETGEITFKLGDEVENNSIRFFIGLINDSHELCFIDKTKPWTVKNENSPMVSCMKQGNFGICAKTLKNISAAERKQLD
jgi:hypothetical protein